MNCKKERKNKIKETLIRITTWIASNNNKRKNFNQMLDFIFFIWFEREKKT